MIVINRTFTNMTTKKSTTETMGLVFLTDLMFLCRQLNFHDILTQPVYKFVMNLNGTEEDRKQYKERLHAQRGTTEMTDNQSEMVSDNYSNRQPKKRRPTEENEVKLSDNED
jgi:hypothetical protein